MVFMKGHESCANTLWTCAVRRRQVRTGLEDTCFGITGLLEGGWQDLFPSSVPLALLANGHGDNKYGFLMESFYGEFPIYDSNQQLGSGVRNRTESRV